MASVQCLQRPLLTSSSSCLSPSHRRLVLLRCSFASAHPNSVSRRQFQSLSFSRIHVEIAMKISFCIIICREDAQQSSPDDDAQLEDRVTAAVKWIRDFATANFVPLGESMVFKRVEYQWYLSWGDIQCITESGVAATALLAKVSVGLIYPRPGQIVQQWGLSRLSTSEIFFIFGMLASTGANSTSIGMNLKTGDMLQATIAWPALLFGIVSILFMITPLAAIPILHFQLTPKELVAACRSKHCIGFSSNCINKSRGNFHYGPRILWSMDAIKSCERYVTAVYILWNTGVMWFLPAYWGSKGGNQVAASRAVILVDSHKTLPVIVAGVANLDGALGEAGLLVLPCIATHPNQRAMEAIGREDGQAVDAALEAVEHGTAAAPVDGFDGVAKQIDNDLYDDDGKPRRTGGVYTSAAHIITAVIGSGVLALSWSFAQMGWIAGPIVLLAFAWCTFFTSRLLTDCYRSPDPVTGKRNYMYMDAIKANLGKTQQIICACAQYSNLVGTGIGYTIATATSAKAIQQLDCKHLNGVDHSCPVSTTLYIAIFGLIQVVLSQIPNFGELWWLSYVAAFMSFAYSIIGLALGISKSASTEGGLGRNYGSLGGAPICYDITNGCEFQSIPQKTWNIFTALGNMAFAYSFSMILIEIQDTIKSPPSEASQMKKSALISIGTTTFFYMSVAICGYAAFGDNAPGNLLTGFSSPYWLVDFANTCIVIHLIGAYQVYTQTVYGFVERWVSKRWPNSAFLKMEYNVRLPGKCTFKLSVFRLTWRTVYVIITTIISMVIPFFNSVMGILGAISFWPLTVYFPIQMYIRQTYVKKGSRKYILLQLLSFITLLVSIAALIGSVAGIIEALKHVILFKAT